MRKYNLFKLGDRVQHKYSSKLAFQIFQILYKESGKTREYLYSCVIVQGNCNELGKEFKFEEPDLVFIRSATKKELAEQLDVAVEDEDYELASQLKKQIDKF